MFLSKLGKPLWGAEQAGVREQLKMYWWNRTKPPTAQNKEKNYSQTLV